MKKTKNFLYLFGVFLIFILLLIIVLYNFTREELNRSYTNSAKNQLVYAYDSLAEKSKEIELLATSILSDEAVRFFKDRIDSDVYSEYDYVLTLKKIGDRISQVEFNSIGIEAIHIYWPEKDLVISTKTAENVKKNTWIKELQVKGRNWNNIGNKVYFSTSYPYIDTSGSQPDYFVVVEMKDSYLKGIKEVVTNIYGAHAAIRLPKGDFFIDTVMVDDEVLEEIDLATEETEIKIPNYNVKVLAKYNSNNGMQIISYFDMGTFLEPAYKISAITFFSTFVILLIGLCLIYLFYRNIFSHLELLIKKFKGVENGDLTTRIEKQSSNEFNYVFDQFNQMVSGVDRLLLSLNNEYQRHDLAERKQLQSQINPHFLYNSLFYIISVAENPEAVRGMSTHLAEYYQYRTKTKDLVLLEEEIDFARSYLSIIAMRKSIHYEIDVEEEALEEMILPLLIQPLLENAIEHGIEEKEGAGEVLLTIKKDDVFFEVSVEEDGNGLDEEQLLKLGVQISRYQNNEEQESVGLWNVNQRLVNYYGSVSAIKLEKSKKLGGLKVSFRIRRDKEIE